MCPTFLKQLFPSNYSLIKFFLDMTVFIVSFHAV